MQLINKTKVCVELENKYYENLKTEKENMLSDYEKILESFYSQNDTEFDDREKLNSSLEEAFKCLDIEKIKTLKFEIDNIKSSDYVGTDS